MTNKIKAFIVEDHSLFVEGLTLLLNQQDKIDLVGVSPDGTKIMQKINRLRPDVVLMDIVLPGTSGIELIKTIRKRHQKLKIIVLSAYDDDYHKLQAFLAGANDYVSKSSCFEQLHQTILHNTFDGKNTFLETISEKISKDPSTIENISFHSLTPIEIEILNFIKSGESLREVASVLNWSIKTLEFHLSSIYSKLHVNNRMQAIYCALKNHIISVN